MSISTHASNLIYHSWNTELIGNLHKSIICIVEYLYNTNQIDLCKADLNTLNECILRIKVNKDLYEKR